MCIPQHRQRKREREWESEDTQSLYYVFNIFKKTYRFTMYVFNFINISFDRYMFYVELRDTYRLEYRLNIANSESRSRSYIWQVLYSQLIPANHSCGRVLKAFFTRNNFLHIASTVDDNNLNAIRRKLLRGYYKTYQSSLNSVFFNSLPILICMTLFCSKQSTVQ